MNEENAPRLARHKSVRAALQYVADHPVADPNVAPIDTPMWELICRELFDIANRPDPKVRGAMARATRAQKLIATRLVGTRRPGSHPAVVRKQQVRLLDLTTSGRAE